MVWMEEMGGGVGVDRREVILLIREVEVKRGASC